MGKITVVDYGLGNLSSVIGVFEALGKKVKLASAPEEIRDAELLVLPGVGAFEDGMKGLKEHNLVKPIQEYAVVGKPLLGICLGSQLFMSESYEFGRHAGLNLISGKVVQFKPVSEINIKGYKVPQVGWNALKRSKLASWKDTALENVPEGADVYFVHSFYAVPDNRECILATAEYGGQEFCAVVRKGGIIGCQFHPEKSGKIGMEIIKSFCKLGEKIGGKHNG